MLRKEFAYTDESGEVQTEEVCFFLHEADLIKMNWTIKGGFDGVMKKIAATEDAETIIGIFDELISKSVGYRNDRGKFVRTKQYAEEFMSSEQYSQMFIELLSTPEKQIEFVKGILPAKLSEGLNDDLVKEMSGQLVLPETDSKPAKKLEDYSRDELIAMPEDQFNDLVGDQDPHHMPRELIAIKMQRDSLTIQAAKAAAKQ